MSFCCKTNSTTGLYEGYSNFTMNYNSRYGQITNKKQITGKSPDLHVISVQFNLGILTTFTKLYQM